MLALSATQKLLLQLVYAISSLQLHLCRPITCQFQSHTRSEPVSYFRRLYAVAVGLDFHEPKLPFHQKTENLFDNANECGRPDVDGSTAIVNGHDAPEKAWPWQVLMFTQGADNETRYCGGSLISEFWVLTAAHCVLDVVELTLYLGVRDVSTLEEDMYRDNSTVQIRGAQQIIAHRGYISHEVDDIALVKLHEAAMFNEYVKPVCLPKPGQTFENGEDGDCYATGWGVSNLTHDAGVAILKQAKINIMPQSMCIFSSALQGVPIDGRILCFDLNDDESGTCQGDSGGPLACKIDGRFVLAGVTHGVPSGFNCSHSFFSPVDVRVTEYLDWIAINVEEG